MLRIRGVLGVDLGLLQLLLLVLLLLVLGLPARMTLHRVGI